MRRAPVDERAGGTRAPPPRALPLLLAPMSGILLVALGQSVLTTALPTVVGELGALQQLPWVVAIGLVTTAASVPLFGRLSDDLGRRRLFRIAVVTFVAGTLASGLAQTLPQLLVARAVQGVGGGGLITLPHAIVADAFSPRERGRYLGYTVSMHVMASVLGPLVGGLLVDHVSWRLALAAPAPVGIYALVRSAHIPEQRRRTGRRVDLTSASLLAAAVVSIMLATLLGSEQGWSAGPTLACAALAAGLLVGYLAHARSSPDPVIPPGLLRNRTVAVTTLVGLLLGMSLHGSLAFLPVFFQVGLDTSAALSGFLMLPLMVGLISTSIPAGRHVTNVGRYRALPVTGTAMLVIGYLAFSRLDAGSSLLSAVVLVALLGAGIGLSLPVLLIAAQAAVPAERLGVATATQQLSKSLGAALGVTAMGAVWNTRLTDLLLPRLGDGSAVSPDTILSSPQAVAALPADLALAVRESVAGATAWTFLLIGLLGLVTHAISWRLREMPEELR